MFDQVMQQVGSVNVQVPVGYVLMGVTALYGVYWTVKKMFVVAKFLALGVLTKFSLAMLGSSALFMGGLAGVGNSIGSFSDRPALESKDPSQAVAYIDKETIKKIVVNAKQDADGNKAREMAFKYAVDQDQKTGQSVVYISAKEEAPEQKTNGNTIPWTVLTTSIGSIAVGLTWMLRRWHE